MTNRPLHQQTTVQTTKLKKERSEERGKKSEDGKKRPQLEVGLVLGAT